jgi:DNA-binding GntR family transcriptional regulator
MPIETSVPITSVARPPDLAQIVEDQLRELILRGVLRPGTPLRQEDLARRLNVSRTPLKQAIAKLASEGLVSTSPSSRAEVVKIGPSEAVDLFEVRELIDGLVARRLAVMKCSPELLSGLETILERMDEAGKAEDSFAFLRAHHDFHTSLLREIHHYAEPHLIPIVRLTSHAIYIQFHADPALSFDRLAPAAQHRQILATIQSGDPDRAEVMARAHIARAKERWARVARGEEGSRPERGEVRRGGRRASGDRRTKSIEGGRGDR